MTSVEVHTMKCCKNDCLSHVYLADILLGRKRFVQMSSFNQKQWILDYLSDHARVGQYDGIAFIVQGYNVCKLAWCAIYGIGEKRLSIVFGDFSKGTRRYEKGGCHFLKKYSLKSRTVIAWMEIYFKRIGDKMPDSLSIHLPSYLDRRTLYRYMCEDFVEQKETAALSYSRFCAIMNAEFPDVSIPKVNRLTKCDVCTVLKDEKEKTMDVTLRNYYDALLQFHNDLQSEERAKYYKHRGKAKDVNYRKKYMCVIIDGMDQSKLLLPSLLRTAKVYSSAWRLKTHVTGVLNHGRENLALVDINQWPHDSNFTMNILLSTISRQQHIPDYLYLQMDNCWRENKNQFVLVFLAVLVQLNIFKKVKVNFLMVGHTHEDVDQLFSRIRQRIFKQDVRFLPELLEAIARSSSPTPCVQLITSMFNIREWVEPAREELHNISNAHCFVIKRSTGPNCEVVLKYKQWSRDNEWLPPGSGIPVLKPNVTPQGLPTFCEPSPDKVDLERLKREIPKFYESRKFDESHKQWWDDFLNNRHGYYSRPGQHLAEWPLPNIIEKKNQQQESESGDQEQEIGILGIPRPTNLPLEVEQLVSSQLDSIPEIYTGPYRPPVRSVTQVGSYENVEVGHLVAVNLQNYKSPNIAEVVARTDKEFTVKWFKGGYRKEWKPDNRWPECSIPQQSVILYGFSLENNRFTADTAKFLRRAYKDVAN